MGGTVLKLRSEELLEEGIEKGIKKGIEKGIDKGILTSLRNLMKNTQVSAEKAMDMLGIHGDDRKKYSAML